MNIDYRMNTPLSLDIAKSLYQRSSLGERRPIEDQEVFAGMLAHANLLISAWQGENLIGIARTLTDFTYVAYLADLAVDQAFQHQGIGRQLIEETKQHLGSGCNIVLLAAPLANDYYPKLGFEPHPRAWVLNRR